jgi:hypothetical protein
LRAGTWQLQRCQQRCHGDQHKQLRGRGHFKFCYPDIEAICVAFLYGCELP